MKKDIFNKYVDNVATIFEITRDDFFSKSKKREFVEARHLVWYLCFNRPMTIIYIQRFMESYGYKISHSPVIYGINSVTQKVMSDEDYINIVNKVDKNVKL
jgi:chromosomal replication initiation ATPase DnaA